jgi:hypothetical protein
MKKVIAVVNPFLASLKYLLLTILMLMIAIGLGQYFLQDFSISAAIDENFKATILPFIGTAAISMFIVQRLLIKKN